MANTGNYKLKQSLLIASIAGLALLLSVNLFIFFPGMLGSVTLYILMRQSFKKLTVVYGWKKWIAATFYIIATVVLLIIPFAMIAQILLPKLNYVLENVGNFSDHIKMISGNLSRYIPALALDEQEIKNIIQKIGSSVPSVLSATANTVSNVILAFFLLYFMLTEGEVMEEKVRKLLPLRTENVNTIWDATKIMVVSNAIGIPVLAACQSLCAALGYWIFGIDQFLVWGILTGIFSLVPIVGSAIIWVPLSLYLMSTGHSGQAVGLLIYSLTVVINIDNVLRFTLLKKIGDVHPIITVFGILVGLPLFGFMGFIFGPLLISYLLLLIKIYRIEYANPD